MNNKLKTLVIVTPGFPENEADSTCIPALQVFVKGLRANYPSLNIIVIAFHYPFVRNEYEWHGVKVFSIGGKSKQGVFRLKVWIQAWQILKRLNKTYQIIGLLSFWLGECAFVANRFAKNNKLRHYTWLTGQDVKAGNKYFNWIKPKPTSLIAMSEFLAEQCKKNYNISPQYIIPFGIDTSIFGTVSLKRNIDILGVGSLIPLKQYHLFVEAVGFLKQYLPNIKAVLCGDGVEMEQLKVMTTSSGLEDNLVFAGEVSHKEALLLMQQSKTFLHPSNYEGFSTVLSEALYAGAHVVSFCKPMAEQYQHHYVIKTNDEMKTQLLTLLDNKELNHQPVLISAVQDVVKNIMKLFDYQSTERSDL